MRVKAEENAPVMTQIRDKLKSVENLKRKEQVKKWRKSCYHKTKLTNTEEDE
jgi:hypothetical protein